MEEKEILKNCPICKNPIKLTEANFTTDKIYCIKCDKCEVIYNILWESVYELRNYYETLSQEDIDNIRRRLKEESEKTRNVITITTKFLKSFDLKKKPPNRVI